MRKFDLSTYTQEELYWAIYQKEQANKGAAPKGR